MISISDNNIQGAWFATDSVKDLLPMGNKSLAELCKENPGLLLFPQCLYETEDNVKDGHIFDFNYGNDGESICLMTGNIMGFVGKGGKKLRIHSRFDTDEHDYFLHYMLQKVFPVNLFALNHSSTGEDIFDLLMFMFPHYLKKAMAQGIYRKYQRYEHNDSNIRGSIDVARHIRRNIPFQGNVAYNTREYSYDNSITQLIRHTIEYIRAREYGEAILNMDEDTQDFVSEICQCTPTYMKGKRQRIMQENLRIAAHPYYQEYIPLQSLCMRILRMEEIKYEQSDKQFSGILFDGAWLWEEYCNTILAPLNFRHPQNKIGTGAIYLFHGSRGPRYPDFYREGFVVDAKYKWLGEHDHPSSAGRDDLHQLITYMYVMQAKKGAFLSPFTKVREVVATGELRGYGGTIQLLGVEIPIKSSNYDVFSKRMMESERKLVTMLTDWCNRTMGIEVS